MNNGNRDNENLKNKIRIVLSKDIDLAGKLKDKSIEELAEEISIYHRELEYQNDELLRIRHDLEKTKARYTALFDDAPIGYVVCNYEYELISANKTFLKLLNIDEVINSSKKIVDFIHPASQDTFYFHFKKLVETKKTKIDEVVFHYREKTITARIESNIFSGEENAIRTAVIDITEQKKAQEVIDNFFEQPINIHLIADFNGTIRNVNKGWESILGFNKDKLIGSNFLDYVHPADKQNTLSEMENLKKGMVSNGFENRYIDKNGNIRILVWSAAASVEDEIYYAVASDITEIKESEQKLRESEEKFSKAFHNNPSAMMIFDPETGERIACNDSYCSLLEISREDLINKNIFEDNFWENRDFLISAIEELKHNNFLNNITVNLINNAGKKITCLVNVVMLNVEGRSLALTSKMNITDRIEAEQKVKESSEKFSKAFDDHPVAMLMFNVDDGKRIDVNKAYERILGYTKDEVIGKSVYEYMIWSDPEDQKKGIGILTDSGELNEYEMNLTTKSGEIRNFKATAAVLDILGKKTAIAALVDITEQRNMENLLRESEAKMTALFKNMPVPTYTYVKQGDDFLISDYNTAAYEFTKGRIDNLIGMYASEFFSDRPDIIEDIQKCYKEKSIIEKEIYYTYKTIGEEKYLSVKYAYVPPNIVMLHTDDRTEELKAVEALRESESRLKAVADNIPGIVYQFKLSPKGNLEFTFISKAVKHYYGYTDMEIMENPEIVRASIHPEDRDRNLLKIKESAENFSLYEIEFRIYSKAGNMHWLSSKAIPQKNESGEIIWSGVSIDITQRKKTEEKVNHLNRLLRAISNVNQLLVKETNKQKLITEACKNFKETAGYDYAWIVLLDENNLPVESEAYGLEKDSMFNFRESIKYKLPYCGKKALETKELVHIENPADICPNCVLSKKAVNRESLTIRLEHAGRLFGLLCVSIPRELLLIEEERNLFIEVAEDIAFALYNLENEEKRKSAEKELRKLNHAIEQSPVCVVITDTEGKIEYVNPQFTMLTGYSREEVIGQNPKVLKSGTHPKEYYEKLWNTIKNGGTWQGEFHNKKANGELFWENAIISPVKDEYGIITNFIAVKEDITEKKTMMDEIIKAKELAEASEKIKTEFLAQMSHEIRSPLNVILNSTSLLKEDLADEPEFKEYGELFIGISSASKRIIRTIELILNMTEIQTGTYTPTFKTCSVKNIIDELLAEYNNTAGLKKLELSANINLADVNVYTDEYALTQILSNLTDNAIKYTREGYVKINAYNRDNTVIIEVEDTGIGMSEEFRKNLFKPFTQETHGYSRTFEGNGLGLALIKNYCSLINTDITVKSEKGKGSTFTVIIG